MVTFYDLIRSNKRKSAVLMVGMGSLLVVLGAALGGGLTAYGGGGAEALIPSLVLGAAAAAVVAPRSSALHHYWIDPDGSLVRLEVESDFYLHYQIGQDPTDAAGVRSEQRLVGVPYA